VSGGFLIVRRDGALWGLPAEQVSGIERVGSVEPATSGLDLLLAGGGRLAVESVVTLAGDLAVQPLSDRLRRFLPAGSSGLAMHAGEPIVLMMRQGGAPHV
jgi:hypothetical protein